MNISFKILFIFLATYLFADDINTNLTKQELKTLKEENHIIRQDTIKKSGFIAFDVDKNIDIVFDEILDLKSYPRKIEDVSKVEFYEKSLNTVKAKIFISTFFIDFYDCVIHKIDKQNYIITWTLDKQYEKENYFAKMDGYWRLKKINDNTTRVFYANNLAFKTWIPTFIENYLISKGLVKSTLWLKNKPKE